MAQIIPQTSRTDFLAQGLAGGLGELLQGKMQQMQAEKYGKFLDSIGVDRRVLGAPKEQQLEIVKDRLLREGYPQAQQQNQGQPDILKILQALAGAQPEPQQMQEQMQQQPEFEPQMATPQLGGQLPISQRLQGVVNEILQGVQQNQAPQQRMQQADQRQMQQPDQQQESPELQSALASLLGGQQQRALPARRMTPQMEQAERMHQEKRLDRLKSESRPLLKEYADKRNATKQQLAALTTQLNLSESGAVNDTGYLTALKKLGLDDPIFKKPGTAAFDALGVNFLTNLKSFFGARPTNFDVKTYLAKLAKSTDTVEGRRRLIRNYQQMLKAENIMNDARMEIVRKNGNIVPHDIDILAEEIAAPKIDKIWDQFVKMNDMESNAPKFKMGQVVTADQAKNLPRGATGNDQTTGKPVFWNGSSWEFVQ